MRRLLVFASLLAIGCDSAPAITDAGADAALDAGTAELPWIRDDRGGVLVLRGTNVSGDSKDPPDFAPNDYATSADFARLHDELGFNAIRYLIFWEAVEPERGIYDDAYLAEVRRRIEAAAAAGLLVIVDMHQDVYGRGFGFDGAPAWTCDQSLYDAFDMHRPTEWYLGYGTPEVQECFDRFWTDTDIRAAFAGAWQHVAETLSDATGVFAYEVINEPSWGSSNVRTFERTVLPAVYADCIDAIRAGDPDAYVVIEPASTVNVGLGTDLRPPDRPRLVVAPHVYPPSLEQGTGWTGTRALLDAWLADLRDDVLAMELPLLVTEVGARPSVEGATTYLRDVYDALDAARFGAMQWDAGRGGYGLWTSELAPSEVALAIVRPHPARTAGVPRAWSWDADEHLFTFEWDEDGSATGETEITAPTLVFPSGADVTIDDGGEWRLEGAIVRIPQVGGHRTLAMRAP